MSFWRRFIAGLWGSLWKQSGLTVASEVLVPVAFRGVLVGSYRADLVVKRKVILEVKTAEQISKAHEAQMNHYLRASEMELGLILNFGETAKFRRVEFRKERKGVGAVSATGVG